MTSQGEQGVLVRENWRAELAGRLILHGVRTGIVTKLTNLSPGRLKTVRRRIGVPNEQRARGPTRWSLKAFLATPQARAEGAALVALCFIFGIPIEPNVPALPKSGSLGFVDRLCGAYEAFCACSPQTRAELEHLILIRHGLSVTPKKALVQLGKCRTCKCLTLELRIGERECWHCDATPTRKGRG